MNRKWTNRSLDIGKKEKIEMEFLLCFRLNVIQFKLMTLALMWPNYYAKNDLKLRCVYGKLDFLFVSEKCYTQFYI